MSVHAQIGIPPLHNYTQKEYTPNGASTGAQNWAFEQDANGVLYVANGAGIMQYDGFEWSLTVSKSLNPVNCLVKDKKGIIWYGGSGDFGYLTTTANGQVEQVSIKDRFPELISARSSDIWDLFITDEAVYFQAIDLVFYYDLKAKTIKEIKSQENIAYCHLVNGEVWIQQKHIGLGKFVKDKIQPVYSTDLFKEDGLFSVLPYSENSLLLLFRENGAFIYSDSVLTPLKTDFDLALKSSYGFRAIQLNNGEYAIGTLQTGLFIMDREGKLMNHVTKKEGLQNDMVLAIYQDKHNVLWLGLDEGITKLLYPTPITFFDSRKGLESSSESIFRYNDNLYISTGKGVYYFDKTSKKFQILDGAYSQGWKLFLGNNRLFSANSDGLFEIANNKIKLFDKTSTYRIFTGCVDEPNNRIYFGHKKGLSVYDIKKNTVIDIPEIEGTIRTIIFQPPDIIWAGTILNGIYKVNTRNFKSEHFDTLQGLPLGANRVVQINNKVYSGTEKGLYAFDENNKNFYPDSSYGKQFINGNDIFRLKQADDGKIWINSGSTIGYLIKPDKEYNWVNIPFLNINEVQVTDFFTENNIAWLGGMNSLIRFDGSVLIDYAKPYNALIRRVVIGSDSTVYYGSCLTRNCSGILPKFDYKNNSVTFFFAAPMFNNEKATNFQIFLEGFDENWSAWLNDNKKQYTNIPEGNYIFKVRAKNIYGTISMMAEYEFKVLPPWYRSIYAYAGYLMLLGGSFVGGIKIYTRRLKASKIRLEKIVKERTYEIVVKNRELESQKNLIEEKNGKLQSAYVEIEEKNKDITDSIQYATRIQNAILPPQKLVRELLPESFILYKPKDILSGDFYWVEQINDHTLVGACDCTGHGVPGALMSIVGSNLLNQTVKLHATYDPSAILNQLNQTLLKTLNNGNSDTAIKDGMDAVLVSINTKNKTFHYSGANNPLFIVHKNQVQEIKADKQPVGYFIDDQFSKFTNHTFNYEGGEMIYLLTDGFADQFGGPSGKKFMYKRLRDLLSETSKLPAEEQKIKIGQAFTDWKGHHEQVDDVLVIGIRLN